MCTPLVTTVKTRSDAPPPIDDTYLSMALATEQVETPDTYMTTAWKT